MAELRDKIAQSVPSLNVEFVQLLSDMIGDLSNAPEPIIIKLFTEDAGLRREWAPRVAAAIEKIPGVVDVMDGIEDSISGPAVTFQVNPAVAGRAGFTPEEIELDTSAILQGEPASTPVVLNGKAYPIRVRFPAEGRASLDAIRNTLLVSGTGKTATLGSLASFTEMAGQTEVRRENLRSTVNVIGRFEGISLGKGMEKVQKAVTDLNLPPAIRVAYGGAFEEQQRSFRDLAFVLVLAIVLVFIVLLFEFGNFAAPIAVLCSALLSTSGVFVALLITGLTFNLSSFMGLIMVIGIVAKNGILLLDADQKYRAEGIPAEESMLRAGERRLRPIMMTALATIAGMIPLALAWGAGSQMLQPLAIAVIGGILASMVLSLVVTPAVRYYLGRDRAAEAR
jgi:multidrug efflux pump subunit AcrB